MPRERTLETQRIYSGRIVNLRVDTVQLASGVLSQREIVEHAPVVAIVPLDLERRQVLLVRQFRKAAETELLEVPAGGLAPGEEVEACARRELQEETGYTAERWNRIGGFWTSPGFTNEYIHVFVAQGLCPGKAAPEEEEEIQLEWVALDQIGPLIRSGRLEDAKTIASLLMTLQVFPL